MKKITNIIVHCSDSAFGSAAMIRKWHLENGWRDIGYHFVIMNGHVRKDLFLESLDGDTSIGRDLDGDRFIDDNEKGAHALGYNGNSIGVCLIGKETFTSKQIGSLITLLNNLLRQFEIDIQGVLGHYETENAHGKSCPNIGMKHIRYLLSLTKGE